MPFLKGISLKVNLIAQLEFELAFNDATVTLASSPRRREFLLLYNLPSH